MKRPKIFQDTVRIAAVWLLLGFAGFILIAVPPAQGQSGNPNLERIKAELRELKRSVGLASGREIYQIACASCHGLSGEGRAPGAKGFEFGPTDFRQGITSSAAPRRIHPQRTGISRAASARAFRARRWCPLRGCSPGKASRLRPPT